MKRAREYIILVGSTRKQVGPNVVYEPVFRRVDRQQARRYAAGDLTYNRPWWRRLWHR